MRTACLSLHQHSDGVFTVHLSYHADGEPIRTILDESSEPQPYLTLSDAWTVASEMARKALRGFEPSPGLFPVGYGRDRTD